MGSFLMPTVFLVNCALTSACAVLYSFFRDQNGKNIPVVLLPASLQCDEKTHQKKHIVTIVHAIVLYMDYEPAQQSYNVKLNTNKR